MPKQITRIFLAAALLTSSLFAAGTGSMPQQSSPAQSMSPQQEAISLFNNGVAARERAAKLEAELEKETEPGRRAKLEKKIQKSYESIARLQRRAAQNDPNLFQAFGELGYALRKSGDHAAALEAYDQALTLRPNYAPAIEYRAEAYLGLNRVEEAKAAFLILFNGGDKAGAQQLSLAMNRWIESRRTSPGDVSTEQVEELAKWVSQRDEISKQSGAPSGGSWK